MERGMENDANDIRNLNGDVLLPPRKRLLAGMKRQNSDMNLPACLNFGGGGSEFEMRMNSLLKSYLSNPYLSNEEIVEASRLAAVEASKAAQAARAAAEEKASKAAKAVAAAKNALELVATITEETTNQEKYLKRNKMKKHVAIQSLYAKHNGKLNWKTDEELARKLHRVINSSPRILKSTSTPELGNSKNKKIKISSSSKKTTICNVATSLEDNQIITNNVIADDIDSDGCVWEKYMPVVDRNNRPKREHRDTSVFDDSKHLITEKREAERVPVKEQVGKADEVDIKKWRFKQKKLPLSIYNGRDLGSPKEDVRAKVLASGEDNRSKHLTSKSLFSVGPSGENVMQAQSASTWKCKGFKVPTCAKQNKVIQS